MGPLYGGAVALLSLGVAMTKHASFTTVRTMCQAEAFLDMFECPLLQRTWPVELI